MYKYHKGKGHADSGQLLATGSDTPRHVSTSSIMEELGNGVFMPHILPVRTQGPKETPCESITASEAHRAPRAYLPSDLTLLPATPFLKGLSSLMGTISYVKCLHPR